MIKKHDGYSRKEAETTFGTLTIEVKTWNHRHCNVIVRTPSLLSQFEHSIQTAVRRRIHRGQAQVNIELSENDTDSSSHLTFNLALAKQYHQGLTESEMNFSYRMRFRWLRWHGFQEFSHWASRPLMNNQLGIMSNHF